MGLVALLSDQCIGRKVIRVPARALLLRCLPAGAEVVAQYTAFLRAPGANSAALSEAQRLPVPEETMLSRIADLAHHVQALTSVYGAEW